MCKTYRKQHLENLIQNCRKHGLDDLLKTDLTLWVVNAVSRRKLLKEDEKGELILALIEKFPFLWENSFSIPIEDVPQFFLHKAFNIRRTIARRLAYPEKRGKLLELWNESISRDEHALWDTKQIRIQADEKTYCLLFLLYDFPLKNSAREFLLQRLKKKQKTWAEFQKAYWEKKEQKSIALQKIEQMILFYTRKLYEPKLSPRFRFYRKQKCLWVDHYQRTERKTLFSEREIARLLGLGRQTVSGIRKSLAAQVKEQPWDLLGCA